MAFQGELGAATKRRDGAPGQPGELGAATKRRDGAPGQPGELGAATKRRDGEPGQPEHQTQLVGAGHWTRPCVPQLL